MITINNIDKNSRVKENIKREHDVSLKSLHTFGLDVKTKELISYNSVEDLQELLKDISEKDKKSILHIGEGSNLLFTKDFDGIILHSNIKHINYHRIDGCSTKIEVRVGAGVNWDDLCLELAQKNIYGTENLSYIPGEVGSAAVQNIGAYGVEVADLIKNVKTIDIETGEVRIFENYECEYDYRKSIFKSKCKGRYIVIEVTFLLSLVPYFSLDYGALKSLKALQSSKSDPSDSSKGLNSSKSEGSEKLDAMMVRNKVIEIRKSKLPELTDFGSAGSFFMNPVISEADFLSLKKNFPEVPYYKLDNTTINELKSESNEVEIGTDEVKTDNKNIEIEEDQLSAKYKIPAAWLIDQCGWKGKKYGGAQVYEKHPLILINLGNAKPEDIVELSKDIQSSVLKKFNINLYPEVLFI